mgnify:CR=1 FL=1
MIDNIKLFNGLNVNPIPLEFSQSMTTTKELAYIESLINNLIKSSLLLNITVCNNVLPCKFTIFKFY